MIVPWIKGFLNWEKAPLTWTLMALNLLFFCLTFNPEKLSVTHQFSNVRSMVLTGKLYYQFQNPSQPLALKTQNEWMMLAGQGLKNPEFIDHSQAFPFFGDQVTIKEWRKQIADYKSQIALRPSHTLGLHSQSTSFLNWVTYQFMHASWFHLIGNMLMLWIFGAAVELTVGGLGLTVIYILGGAFGAWTFLGLGNASLAPMIGASGSLSAVMAFFAAYEKKKRVSFFYFVSPLPGYYGWIYLPTILIFPLCFLSDLAGYIGTSQEIGTGVAYAAHIGGALFGGVLGFTLRYFRRHLWVRWISQH